MLEDILFEQHFSRLTMSPVPCGECGESVGDDGLTLEIEAGVTCCSLICSINFSRRLGRPVRIIKGKGE
jgi:hypothetical protein